MIALEIALEIAYRRTGSALGGPLRPTRCRTGQAQNKQGRAHLYTPQRAPRAPREHAGIALVPPRASQSAYKEHTVIGIG